MGSFKSKGAIAAIVALAWVSRPGAALADSCFPQRTDLPLDASDQARDSVAADLDGDGRVDLVTSLEGSDELAIWVAPGEGAFTEPARVPVGSRPRFVAVADLNGDAAPDIAVVHWADDEVGILLGNGDATFRPGATYGVGARPSSLLAGDLDGNGTLDLVTTDEGADTVSVLLGLGDGSFQAALSSPAGRLPNDAAAGDFDDDGVPDLAIANPATFDVTLLRGAGDGTFDLEAVIPVRDLPWSVAVADLDGDARADVVAARRLGESVSVVRRMGPWAFEEPVSFPAGPAPTSVSVADADGDSVLDLLVVNEVDVAILRGRGGGSFEAPRLFSVAPLLSGGLLADLDGDSLPEVVATSRLVGLGILQNEGEMRLSAPTSVSLRLGPGQFQKNPLDLVVADLDADSLPDLLTTNRHTGFSVLFGEGGRRFQRPEPIDLGVISRDFDGEIFHHALVPQKLVVEDLDGDGLPDLIGAATAFRFGGVGVRRGLGGGRLAPVDAFFAGQRLGDLAVADFDADGRSDVVTSHQQGPVNLLRGLGGGVLGEAFPIGSTNLSLTRLRTGLLNGDALPDIILFNLAFLSSAPGVFGEPKLLFSGLDSDGLDLADFDEDGDVDLVVVGRAFDAAASVLLGDGTGTFGAPRTIPTLNFADDVVAGDVDGDGATDIVTSGGRGIAVHLGRGDGTFGEAERVPAIYGSHLQLADIDRDGAPDVSLIDAQTIAILWNRCAPAPRIDVHPKRRVNRIPRRSGIVPVAILGSAQLDVDRVRRESFRFGPTRTPPLQRPRPRTKDVNGDGFRDLVGFFWRPHTGIEAGDTEACADFATEDGASFHACDSVVVPAHPPGG